MADNNSKATNEIAVVETNNKVSATSNPTPSRVLNLFDEKQLATAEIFLKKIMTSDKGGIKSVNEGLAILMRAQDLQLPFSSCIEHIHVINGKTGVDVHIIRSLLLRAGVTWERTKDYTPLYQYTDGNMIYKESELPDYCVKCRTEKEAQDKTTNDVVGVYPLKFYKDLNNNTYHELQINEKCVIALNPQQAIKLKQEGKFPIIRIPSPAYDYQTEYEFTRYMMVNNTERVMKVKERFNLSEAIAAGLVEKDNYKKYARIMVAIRAFTLGAREIADDVIMGCLEYSELNAIEKKPIDEQYFEEVKEII